MLLKYNVSNFKSIGHEIEFSMFPSSPDIDEKYTNTLHTKVGEWKVLKRGAFFGPNASGKSSFIQSIEFAVDYIISGNLSGREININQFKGCFEELEGQSIFQFLFLAKNNEIYQYGFTLDSKQIYEECLMILTKQSSFSYFLPNYHNILLSCQINYTFFLLDTYYI